MVELKEAEARPAKATTKAKRRTAAFIFGNLSIRDVERDLSMLTQRWYPKISIKSIYFFQLTNYDRV